MKEPVAAANQQPRIRKAVKWPAYGAPVVLILAAQEIIPAIIQRRRATAQAVRVQALARVTPTTGTLVIGALVVIAASRVQYPATAVTK